MYTYSYLFDFTKNVFLKMGCSEHDAGIIAEVFLAAEMRDHASHGMIRIKDYYELWKAARINVKPNIRVVHESPSTAVIDGDNAVGMVAAKRSMELAIEKAEKSGTGWVATRHSNHFGIAGYYAMMALKHDMIGICLTNANPLVAPTFSISRMMGTLLLLILQLLPLPGESWQLLKRKGRKLPLVLCRIIPECHLTIQLSLNLEDQC
jgi:L-2-hydroxycarboxylate dehydrogenase (NAD+)